MWSSGTMPLDQIGTALARGMVGFWNRTRPVDRFAAALALFGVSVVVMVGLGDAIRDFRFTHLSASEHLQLALSACGFNNANPTGHCTSPLDADRQLAAIGPGKREYSQATLLRSAVNDQIRQDQLETEKRVAENRKLAYQRFQTNTSGEAHDPFTCATSTEQKPIVSFDEGITWWNDDGRCAAKQQKVKDSDAEIRSYISTTIRVDTDMESSWLPDEERTCQTYPDGKGRVATVSCNGEASTHAHNIPVKFWGGVDRNAPSDWKCRREKTLLSDEFVCRATD
jgi:hypothetical protein